MAMMPAVDRRSVGAGAVIGIAVAVVMILFWVTLDALADIGEESNLVFLPYLVVVGGWACAGFVSARRRPEAPFTHGALAAALAAAVVVALVIVVRLALGDPVKWSAMLSHVMVAASAGILGALVSTVRR